MTILKSILVTLLSFIIVTLLDFLIFGFHYNLAIYPHIVGLSYIVPILLSYILLIVYLHRSTPGIALKRVSIVRNYWLLMGLLIFLAIGDHLVDLPLFHWKDLSNKYFGTKFEIPQYPIYKFSFFKLYNYFSVLLVAPIFEEIFFRYYIFGGMLKKYSFLTALLVSSILFALIHIDSPRNLIPTFVFGIITAFVYFRTQKIIYSILLHFFTNAMWLVSVVFTKQYDHLIKVMDFGIAFWIVFLFGIILIVFGVKKLTAANMGLPQAGPDKLTSSFYLYCALAIGLISP